MSIFSKIFNKRISDEANKRVMQAAPMIAKGFITRYGRGFSNAYNGRGGGEKTRNGLASSGQLVDLNHALLRRNARKAFHESSQARILIERFSNTVADIGLQLEPSPSIEILGITAEEGEKWAKEVEVRFNAFAESKKQHRSGTMNFNQSQRLYQIIQHRDNDQFVRLYYSDDNKLLSSLQFELIDPDQLEIDTFTNSSGYTSKRDAIQRNKKGEEIAYVIMAEDPSVPGKFERVTIPATSNSGNRRFMLHGFTPEYPGQGRGYSRLSHLVQDFEHLTDFEIAQVEKAIAQSIMAFTVESDSALAPQEINLGSVGIDAAVGTPPTENPVTETTIQVNQLQEMTYKESGSAMVLQPQGKQKLKPIPNTSPSDSYDSFVDAKSRYLFASSSMPIEVALMKFGTNYSASRASLLLFWEEVIRYRKEMATDYLNPIYEAWLSEEIAAGRIQAPGWSDPLIRAAWLNCRWIGSSIPNIDPLKTAKADKENISMGATTLNRVARKVNGSDYKTNVATLAREFDKLPLPPWDKKNNQETNKINKEELDDE